MKIINSEITIETCNRFYDVLKDKEFRGLKKERIILNYANSKFNEKDYKGYRIINSVSAIRNCVDKKRMFYLLHKNKINALDFYDFSNFIDVLRCLFVLRDSKLVLRRNFKSNNYFICDSIKDFLLNFLKYDYATKYEEKEKEFRVLMFRDEVLEIYEKRIKKKFKSKKVFDRKRYNCKFVRVNKRDYNKELVKLCRNARKILGIDICGIDVLKNSKGYKIIEVNSGAGIRRVDTIRKILNLIEKWSN